MGHRSRFLSGVCGALLAAAGAGSAVGEPPWTDAEKEHFLLHAEIERVVPLAIGVTHSQRATMSLDGRSHDAHIQTVDVLQHKARVGGRMVLDFRDSYRYNVAAYRLDRLLGLGMVPVSVLRQVEGRMAAVTWWLDDVLMMEKERLEGSVAPPDPGSWSRQGHSRRVFNQLTHNLDGNQGNILITRDWNVRLIDFTRAFRRDKKLSDPASLVRIESSLLERLRGLSRGQLETGLSDCLTPAELYPLLARRDAIVGHFDREIERQGAAAVIYEDAIGDAEELSPPSVRPGQAADAGTEDQRLRHRASGS